MEMYVMKDAVQVGKWGNSLAVRLPSTVVEALQLKECDEVTVELADPRTFRVERDRTRDDALARGRLRNLADRGHVQDGMLVQGRLTVSNPFRTG